MDPRLQSDAVRQASGLPHLTVLTDPVRVARVQEIAVGATDSDVLRCLVRLAAKVASADCAQLSLLTDEQVATAVRCDDDGYSQATSALADSLCTVTVLSGDVLVAADARAHPWLLDLPPVVSGAVRNYLGVPLLLVDDVLFTGRSIRAALNLLNDFGRPSAIRLAVLVDRGGRELPIQPDFVALTLDAVPRDHRVNVRLKEIDGEDRIVVDRKA